MSTSYVAEGTIFNFPAVAESNADIDIRRDVRAPGAIPSADTCSSHSSDPTPRVIHTKLPIFGVEEDAADNRVAVILETNRVNIETPPEGLTFGGLIWWALATKSENTARLLASLSINYFNLT